MAYTQADLSAVQAAIASGEMTVKHNGREVTYRSIAELRRAEDRIMADLAGQQQPGHSGGGSWRYNFTTARGD